MGPDAFGRVLTFWGIVIAVAAAAVGFGASAVLHWLRH